MGGNNNNNGNNNKNNNKNNGNNNKNNNKNKNNYYDGNNNKNNNKNKGNTYYGDDGNGDNNDAVDYYNDNGNGDDAQNNGNGDDAQNNGNNYGNGDDAQNNGNNDGNGDDAQNNGNNDGNGDDAQNNGNNDGNGDDAQNNDNNEGNGDDAQNNGNNDGNGDDAQNNDNNEGNGDDVTSYIDDISDDRLGANGNDVNMNATTYNNDNGYYYGGEISFEQYEVTTVNPGLLLLAITVAICASAFLVGYFALPGKCFNKIFYQSLKRSKKKVNKKKKDIDGESIAESLISGETKASCYYQDMELHDYIVDLAKNANRSLSEGKPTTIPDWRKATDKDTGKEFYYNMNTFESTWIRPEELGEEDKKNVRSNLLKQQQLDDSHRDLMAKERVYVKALGRQRSMARRKVGNRVKSDDNFLSWVDFIRVFIFREKRSQSVPNMSADVYTNLDDGFLVDDNLSKEENDKNKRVRRETKKIIGLGAPWMAQSIISEGSSIVTVALISHYMGLRAIICYSNVWMIVYSVFLINDAWYDTVYKHVNVSAAEKTKDGYLSAGLYLKVGVIGNFFIAIPFSFLSVFFMSDILRLIGHDEIICEMSTGYALVAVLNNLFDSTTGLIDCVLDIEGHATFTAIFEFWDSVICAVLQYLFMRQYRPNLWQLGIFHLAQDVLFTLIYFIIAGYYKRWFQPYREGIRSPLKSSHTNLTKKLVKMTLPLTVESFMGNLEYIVLTIFAAHMGIAEASVWVLLGYAWTVVGIAPDSFGAASSCRVAKLLGKGEKDLAKMVSLNAIRVGAMISFVCSILLMVFRKQFVWLLSEDETIRRMLLELIPYIAICQPFFTVGWTAMEINDALHLFKKAMVSNTTVLIVFTLPIAYVFTYVYNYNLEGIACAQCVSYTIGGVISLIFFAVADWTKAERKAQEIKAELKYEGSMWDDMPIEARAAATVLGYTQYEWDNDLIDKTVDLKTISKRNYSAAKIMLRNK